MRERERVCWKEIQYFSNCLAATHNNGHIFGGVVAISNQYSR